MTACLQLSSRLVASKKSYFLFTRVWHLAIRTKGISVSVSALCADVHSYLRSYLTWFCPFTMRSLFHGLHIYLSSYPWIMHVRITATPCRLNGLRRFLMIPKSECRFFLIYPTMRLFFGKDLVFLFLKSIWRAPFSWKRDSPPSPVLPIRVPKVTCR